jgi:radical SAM superfamily enzyme YgiQ (UPF0313 family)
MMHLILDAFALFSALTGTGYCVLGRNRHGKDRRKVALLEAPWGSKEPDAFKAEPYRMVRVYFIKPSRYDEDGYLQHYRWGVQPNNTLTVLSALNAEFNKCYGAQRNVHLETIIWDEVCDGPVAPATIKAIKDKAREDGVELLVGLAGVQSNQYPRGRDLALQFVREGIPTLMGGFHVSGYPESCEFLNSCGVTTVKGEAENLWPEIINDYLAGKLRLHYSVTEGIRAKTGTNDIIVPLIADAQLPRVDDRYLGRFFNKRLTTVDTSRGCPFTCSYCSVKNIMGRTMRARDPQAVVDWVRDAIEHHGVDSLFIVDDNFFRNPRWEDVLLGMTKIREKHPSLNFMMQVDIDAACYANLEEGEKDSSKHQRSRRFVELAARAGCYQAFVGIESLNPVNLAGATKFQNTNDRRQLLSFDEACSRVLKKYRRTVDNWHRAGISVHAGYILGFPFDGEDCGRVAARTLRELGFDIVSFFIMTPLPGTEDQVRYAKEGLIADWDFNNLDSQHVTLKHELLDKETWLKAYREAFTGFYSIGRLLHTIFTVAAGHGLSAESRRSVVRQFIYYFFSYRQGRHPMVGGIWQIRRRDVRRLAYTDEDARECYLGGRRFDAIISGTADGNFGLAPA